MDGADRLKMAEDTLFWSHMAPSAPDTLCKSKTRQTTGNRPFFFSTFIGCHPFQDSDPFLLKDCPHVYFIGNQPQFETRLVEGKKRIDEFSGY
jgi:DNA polymerase delta subunit 2